MKIQEIQIKGLFGKKDIRWKLNPQVNVLVGVNGSGKSTILSVIYGFLNQTFFDKLQEIIDSAKMFFPTGRINLKIEEKQSTEEILNDLYDEIGKEKADIYFKNNPIFEKLRQLLAIQDSIGKGITNYFHEGKTIYKKENFYIDLIEANLSNSNSNQTITRSNGEEENILDLEIRETIDKLNKIKTKELIDRLSSSLNVFFNQIDKHVSYENNELIYTDTQLQTTLNYSNLSSGERQLIYILLRVALSNGDKSKTAIILMDEPEISLHLDWQEHFIKQLTILNPDAQFIIVTHSPALIMNGWNDVYVDMEEITTWL